MIEILRLYIEFALQGPQEFCVACAPIGFAMLFTSPMKAAKPKQAASRKRKAAANTTRAVKKKKPAKVAKKKPWAVLPNYSPAQLARIEEMFRRGRGGAKYDGAWSNGFSPL